MKARGADLVFALGNGVHINIPGKCEKAVMIMIKPGLNVCAFAE